MLPSDVTALRDALRKTSHSPSRFLWSPSSSFALGDLECGSALGDNLPRLSGHSVLIATRDQLATALALIELDGVVRRLTLCPPDLPSEYLPSVIANAGIDAIVSDRDPKEHGSLGIPLHVNCTSQIGPRGDVRLNHAPTEWVPLTSGTTGLPKMVVHSLASLTGAIKTEVGGNPVVWGTFYDVRRYGELQISSPHRPRWGSLRTFECRGATRSIPRSPRSAPCHTYRRNCVASAWVLMSPAARRDFARICSLDGRDCRPSDTGQFAFVLSASSHQPCLRFDGNGRCD